MREIFGDLWTYPADARVVTTNGTVRNDGAAVMGRGCAAQLKDRFRHIEYALGQLLDRHGNHVFILTIEPEPILSFPVKQHWKDKADIDLIIQSAYELRTIATAMDLKQVVLPRPGCGNGGLEWESLDGVKIHLVNKLDDRFHVIDFAR